jgi:glycosyltransferase involved in cell wall biosynthesis
MTSPKPRITIGVPVYNGEKFLPECLDCLAGQSSREFQVLIMDNASTDRTSEIAANFAARDPRFKLLRQKRNVGARQNFTDVLAAAGTEYFAWRAYDDLCDANWIETLAALLDENPGAGLAAGRVVGVKLDGRMEVNSAGPPAAIPETTAEIRALALSIVPSWYYGLYRREEIARVYARCRELFGYAWSLDILVVLAFILNRSLIGTDATSFRYRATDFSQSYLRPNHYADSWALWRAFHRAASALLRESRLNPSEQRGLMLTMFRIANQRSEKPRRILRGALGAWLLGRDGRVRNGPLVRVPASR